MVPRTLHHRQTTTRPGDGIMAKMMSYNQVSPLKVEKVELLDTDSEEWKEYKKSLYDKNREKTDAQKEREDIIRRNKKKFETFQTDVEWILQDDSKLVELLEDYIKHKKQASIKYSGKDKYGNEIYTTPFRDYTKYEIISDKIHWKKININRETQQIEIYSEVKEKAEILLKKSGYTIVEEEKFRKPELYDLPKFYDQPISRLERYKERIEQNNRRRNEILRFCWYRHLSNIEDFNVNRAEAYLRDLGSEKSKEHKSSKNGDAYNFEHKVRTSFKALGLPDEKRVLKISMKNGETKYKEFDIHTEIGLNPLVVEVFTQRDLDQKKRQLTNYVRLLNKFYEIEVKGLLLTTYYLPEDKSSDEFADNISRELSRELIMQEIESEGYPILKLTKDFEVVG